MTRKRGSFSTTWQRSRQASPGWNQAPGDGVQRFGCNIGPVRPRDRTAIDKESLEVRYVVERLEDRTYEQRAKIDDVFRAVVENDTKAVTADVLGVRDAWQVGHVHTLRKRWDALKCVTRASASPIGIQPLPVGYRPTSDELAGAGGTELSGYERPCKVERRVIALILGVEVRRHVLRVEHPDDDTVKDHNDGHIGILNRAKGRSTSFILGLYRNGS
jgi:hypothetical protein